MAALAWVALRCAKTPRAWPVTFGLAWFAIGLLPDLERDPAGRAAERAPRLSALTSVSCCLPSGAAVFFSRGGSGTRVRRRRLPRGSRRLRDRHARSQPRVADGREALGGRHGEEPRQRPGLDELRDGPDGARPATRGHGSAYERASLLDAELLDARDQPRNSRGRAWETRPRPSRTSSERSSSVPDSRTRITSLRDGSLGAGRGPEAVEQLEDRPPLESGHGLGSGPPDGSSGGRRRRPGRRGSRP